MKISAMDLVVQILTGATRSYGCPDTTDFLLLENKVDQQEINFPLLVGHTRLQMSDRQRFKATASYCQNAAAHYARMTPPVICSFFWWIVSSAKMHGVAVYPAILEGLRLFLALLLKTSIHYLVLFGSILHTKLCPGCESEFWDAMPFNPAILQELPTRGGAQENYASDANQHEHDSLASTSDSDNERMGTNAVQVVHCDTDAIFLGSNQTTLILAKKKKKRDGRERIRALREARMKKGLDVAKKGDPKD